ncbi:diguanylate cyclase domain-containing protein [Candidatus Magnetaquicoccus inordinatus]|uniref:diguanylate cyclase domain-containing protein n=1 Tax=Candidatus Magnetaquicoccus inordinatus TaxID=2496818 RepID=UPI00102AE21F|nr:diguanylate cyclase [Candidatus Magnetaquicoccus inordinatus]
MYIHHKLGLGFGAIVGLTLLLTALSWQNTQIQVKLEKSRDTVALMQEQLLEARRHEKNFLLRRDQQWLQKAHDAIEQLDRQVQEMGATAFFNEQPYWQLVYDQLQNYLLQIHKLLDIPNLSHEEQLAIVETELVPPARQLHHLFKSRWTELSQTHHDHLRRSEKTQSVLITLSMIISALLVWFITRSIIASLQMGMQFAKEIAKGNLRARIPEIPRDEVGALLQAMQQMGSDLQQLEERDVRAQAARLALNALLESSLEPLSLQRQMEVALHIIMTVPYLRLQNKGAVFLIDQEENQLQLIAGTGLSPGVLEGCSKIALGHCLCGKVAQEGKLLHASDQDSIHTTHYEGMQPHGHYCVPISSRGSVLGVLTLYLAPDHAENADEVAFLTSIANTLAGILERKRMEERLQHLAHHDLLTSLPNRVLFAEHLARSLAMAARSKERLAVMLVDLDHFKQVNDTLGHAAGDRVLVISTQRIRDCLRASDLVARMGGDEFAVILSDLPSQEAAELVAGKIVQQVSQSICWEGHSVHVGASIGIAFFPEHGCDADSLLSSADMAMYRIKKRGRNGFCIHDPAWSDDQAP